MLNLYVAITIITIKLNHPSLILKFFYTLHNYTSVIISVYLTAGHCTDPGPMVNGHIKKANETEEGSLMVFQCNAGFTLHSSSSTFQCRSGQWSIRPEDMMCTKTEVTIKPKNMTGALYSTICLHEWMI